MRVFRQGRVTVQMGGSDSLSGDRAIVFFFVYSYSHEAYLDYGSVHFDRFLAAVRAVAARCKLPSAIRPGLPHEDSKRK
jgi:hypothetical protein